MKKQWLPLVLATFFLLAPVVRADDGAASSTFDQLIAQLVSIFSAERLEIEEVSTLGAAEEEAGVTQTVPPGAAVHPEVGEICPPWG